MKKKTISDWKGREERACWWLYSGDKIEEKARLFHFVSSNIS